MHVSVYSNHIILKYSRHMLLHQSNQIQMQIQIRAYVYDVRIDSILIISILTLSEFICDVFYVLVEPLFWIVFPITLGPKTLDH